MNVLDKIVTLENEAAEFGFEWETADQIMEQIQSECVEVREHLNKNSAQSQSDLQEEIGDLLHAVFSLCVFCKLDPKVTLQQALEKFEWRLHEIKQIAAEKKLTNLRGMPFEELMALWQQAKLRINAAKRTSS
ncbi:MAG: nucleoside triphosphate hydrolase [Tatlockia sp.]|nr:nucleoside triphosphate hydrolase [Tatlockia sp.]